MLIFSIILHFLYFTLLALLQRFQIKLPYLIKRLNQININSYFLKLEYKL